MPPSVSSETIRRCGRPTATPNACGVTHPSCCWNKLALRMWGAALYHSSTLAPRERIDQLVLEAGGEPLHAFEAVHRTTLPASTTAE